MAFFLIVPSVMIVGIVLVHALANRLGLRIFYKTLVAVAVLSIAAVFAATKFAPAVGKDFLFLLGLIILAASLLATLLNRFLLKRQRVEEERFTEEVKAAYAAEVQKNSEPSDESNAPLETLDAAESDEDPFRPPSRYDEIRDAILSEEPQSAQKESAPVTQEPATVEPVAEKSSEPSAPERVIDEIPDDQKNFPLEKVFKPLAVIKPAEADKPVKLEEKPDPAENFPLQEVFKPLATVKPAEADKPVKPAVKKSDRAEFFPLQEVFAPLSTVNLDKIEELAQTQSSAQTQPTVEPVQVQPSDVQPPDKVAESVAQVQSSDEPAPSPPSDDEFGTLDDILDKAYAERDKGHVWQAIELYRKALERYRTDEYAPFVAIDLGNIYKEQALYSKAIKTYEDALNLPAVRRNATVKKDFLNNLRYLRIVRDVLLRHRASTTPFTKLPKPILREIDAEFNRIQLNPAQSK